MADPRMPEPTNNGPLPLWVRGEGRSRKTLSPSVFLVDPDPQVQATVRTLAGSVGLPVETYSSTLDFLAAYDPARPGCLILELRLPGLGGIDLQQRLARHAPASPVIILTAHGDVATAVRAMRGGAVDFLQKPVHPQRLLDRIHEAVERDAAGRRLHALRQTLLARVACLRPPERAIMDQVVIGRTNVSIAAALGLTRRAVERHRARLMRKMQAGSLAELVRMSVVLAHGIDVLSDRSAGGRTDLFEGDDLVHLARGSVRPAGTATEHV
jgi:two-component system response regulator FixJ